jgi:hypothetical protein
MLNAEFIIHHSSFRVQLLPSGSKASSILNRVHESMNHAAIVAGCVEVRDPVDISGDSGISASHSVSPAERSLQGFLYPYDGPTQPAKYV